MLIETERRELTIEGAVAKRQFSIALGGHVMGLLSGLYSDIPFAICREYMSNALDGYARLPQGSEIRPPVLHLPNALEPYLGFSDYGSGMDFSTTWDVFTSYGASTKRDDNVEVGGFGLGCKTAFCYADQWTLQSRYAGECHVFSAMKDEEGVPSLVHLFTSPTDEPNGVSIEIPVRTEDFGKFAEAAKRMLAYFPIDCKVVGATGFAAPKPSYIIRAATWGMRRPTPGTSGDSKIVMGNVPYPISSNTLLTLGGFSYGDLNGLSIDLYVPIGAVSIVPSREALQFTEHTNAGITTACKTMMAEFKDRAADTIQAAPSRWEALRILYDTWHSGNLRDKLLGITWRGQPLDPRVGLSVDIRKLLEDNPGLTFEEFGNDGYHATIEKNSRVIDWEVEFTPGSKFWVWLHDAPEDKPFRAETRVRTFLREKAGGRRRYAHCQITGLLATWPGHTSEELSALLNGVPVRSTTELPAPPPRVRTPAGPRVRTTVKILKDADWHAVDVDVADGGWYCSLASNVTLEGHANLTVANLFTAAKVFGLVAEDAKLYGIPRTCASLEGKPGWKPFLPYVIEATPRVLRQHRRAIARGLAYKTTDSSCSRRWIERNLEKLITSDSLATRRIATVLLQAKQDRPKGRYGVALAQLAKLPEPTKDTSIEERWKALYERFPLLYLITQPGMNAFQLAALYNYLGIKES
jgi:hypothetical protein